jgi:glyoxylase-like metal-dependent hydrolase (beta-lactamase superfamily II)
MKAETKVINLGGVNCYLVRIGGGFILIDTGVAARRADLERELVSAGCQPGHLKLIILTHGDSDHADNAAYLRDKYGALIAMHQSDAGMVERGDMSWNRKARADRVALGFRLIMVVSGVVQRFRGPARFDTFTPDLILTDGADLAGYGFDARVLHLPGHSKGSLGILTARGELFCGDLLYNFGKPGALFLDDLADFRASLARLEKLEIGTVYPGHGKSFPLERFTRGRRRNRD